MSQRLAGDPVRLCTSAEMLARLNRDHGLNLSSWRFREAILTGVIPARRGEDGRSWVFDVSDEPAILEHFRAARPHPGPRPMPRPRPAETELPPVA